MLPDLVAQAVWDWNLELGKPYAGGAASYGCRAVLDSVPVVLKIQYPDREGACEAAALRLWDGRGAVRLLAERSENRTMLIERCELGGPLGDAGVDPIPVLGDLLPELWVTCGPEFNSLAQEAAGWADALPQSWEAAGHPCEWELVDAALSFIDKLAPTQEDEVLLNQDLHGGNVLSAQRAPWLVIDPKPLRGERAFALAPIVRSFKFGHSRAAVIDRLDRLSRRLDIDRDRALGWAIAQTMA